jgi:hypothetical protein
MKNFIMLALFGIFGLAMFSGCAIVQQPLPNNERKAENQMFVIEERIGKGMKNGTLSLNESQVFETTLQRIKTDYNSLRNRTVYRGEWDRLFVRLDMLQEDIDRALIKPVRMEGPRISNRIIALQTEIDDGRLSRRLHPRREREFQSRLNSTRRDYFRMTENGRHPSHEERVEISQQLDLLERDLDRFR